MWWRVNLWLRECLVKILGVFNSGKQDLSFFGRFGLPYVRRDLVGVWKTLFRDSILGEKRGIEGCFGIIFWFFFYGGRWQRCGGDDSGLLGFVAVIWVCKESVLSVLQF